MVGPGPQELGHFQDYFLFACHNQMNLNQLVVFEVLCAEIIPGFVFHLTLLVCPHACVDGSVSTPCLLYFHIWKAICPNGNKSPNLFVCEGSDLSNSVYTNRHFGRMSSFVFIYCIFIFSLSLCLSVCLSASVCLYVFIFWAGG